MDCELIRDDVLDVLYGEAAPDARTRVDAHLAECAACREDLDALRGLRRTLQAWEAPAPPRVLARPPARHRFVMPLAAAAALVVGLVGALAAGGSDLQVGQGRLALRLGRDAEVRRLLAEQDARHRREIEALKAEIVSVRAAAATPAPSDERVLEAVRALIRDSEQRQLLVASASLRELADRTEAQRQYDLARISAGLSYLDGKTGMEVARTTELMGQVLRASQQK